MSYLQGFNPDEIDTESRGGDIPINWYLAVVDDVSEKGNKNGTGRILNVTYEILEGDYAERKIFQNINYAHRSEKCQEIGLIELARLCKATKLDGKGDIQTEEDFDKFTGRTVMIRGGCKDGDYKVYDQKPDEGLVKSQKQAATDAIYSRPKEQARAQPDFDGFDDDIPG